MNFYLSSMMIGDHAEVLRKMAGPNARMAIITNALDAIPVEAQLFYAREKFDAVEYFSDYGFDPAVVDLRYYFGRQSALRDVLKRHRVVWALGGNAFLLRKAMRQSSFDTIIDKLVESDGLIYSGWSAGACVAGESLRGIDLMDQPDASAIGYETDEIVWDGLGLVPYVVVPHFESDHPEADAAKVAVDWLTKNNIDYRALRDGEVIVGLDGEKRILERTRDLA